MLFNSIGFLFGFLPLLLLAYYLTALSPWPSLRRVVLIVGTLAFYAFGGIAFVGLLLASLAVNFAAGIVVHKLAGRSRAQTLALAASIVGNVTLLGYFKYFNFLLTALNDLGSGNFAIEHIALPLGISFFTFQQIGYLVDVSRGKAEAGRPLDYASFVLFFPQLLAGPIVQYRETVPQLAAQVVRGTIGRSILIGLAIFGMGLFKKTVLADTLALYASPVFTAAREGEAIGLVDTWLAAFSYTAQIYFDFSGYSDMAIGTARMFGIVLPLNFHSPLRSASVVEIWRRWHITLGRWVQSYIFQPLTLPLARFAAQRGLGKWPTLALGVVVPTMVSMLIIGVWHGAGWPFVVFGLMHGLYMSVNEIWAAARRKARKQRKKEFGGPPAWHEPVARAATLLAFVLAIVPFGSPDLGTIGDMFAAMAGGGAGLVQHADWPLGLQAGLAVLLVSYLVIYLAPNTQQIMGLYEPVLEWSENWSQTGISPITVHWRMTAGWTLVLALVFFLGVAFIMRGTAQFIYFNF